MKNKRRIAILSVLVVVMTALVGCGNKSDNVNEQSELMEEVVFPLEETMNFTAIAVMSGQYSLEENLAWQTSLERANISFDLTSVLNSEITEKTNLLLSSGAYPEGSSSIIRINDRM